MIYVLSSLGNWQHSRTLSSVRVSPTNRAWQIIIEINTLHAHVFMIREDAADMIGYDMSGTSSKLKHRDRDLFLLFCILYIVVKTTMP